MTEPDAGQEAEADFLKRIKPELDQMEIMREVKLNAYLWRQKMVWPIGAAVLIVTLFVDYLLTQNVFKAHFPVIPVCSIIAAFGLFIWTGRPRSDYVTIYKENITPRIAKLVGLTSYDPKGKIPSYDMHASRIVPGHSGYRSEDYFEGAYKGALIRFAQVKFTKQKSRHHGVTFGSGNRQARTQTVVVFQGLALLITLPQPVCKGHTILVKNSDQFSEWLTGTLTGLKNVPLAKPGLESLYSVFSNNPAEADSLIDDALLSRVVRLSEAFRSRGISLAFYGSQIFMLIASDKDFFEPANIAVPATNIETVRSIKRELQQVFGLVDGFGLVAVNA